MTFVEALTRRGIRYRLAGLKCHIGCVFCIQRGKNTDTKQRLCIHLAEGWGRCMSCDWRRRSGAAQAVLRELGVSGELTGGAPAPVCGPDEAVTLPEDFQSLVRTYDTLDRRARRYLLERGITPEQIKQHRIGVSLVGRYAYRIVFPVYYQGKLVGINARDFTDTKKPKYLTSRGVKALAYFDPECSTTVLSEGVIKALRIAQVTAFGSAALLGHDLPDFQLEQILNSSCKHIVLYPDLDRVGLRGAVNIADKLLERWAGQVSFVWPVRAAADDLPLEELRTTVARNRIVFNGLTRPRFLLA